MKKHPDSTIHSGLDRRAMLKGLGAGALGAAALGGATAGSTTPDRVPLDLNDPVSRLRARVKTFGSLAEETVHRVSRGHVWAYFNEGSLEPLFSMINYNVTRWRQVEETKYEATMNEVALFTRFDTDEVITHWDNPYTGETVEVQQYIVGPIFYWDSFMFFAAEIADLENWTEMKNDMVEFMKNRTPATAEPE